MTEARHSIERLLWTALVAALATSLVWLSAVVLVVVLRDHAPQLAAVATVVRALGRAATLLLRHCGPVIPAALISAGILAIVARTLVHGGPVDGRVRHVG